MSNKTKHVKGFRANDVICIILTMLIQSSIVFSQEIEPCTCRRLTEAPVLNGRLRDDPAWQSIKPGKGFFKLGKGTLANKQTSFRMGYDSNAIYIGVECEEPDIEKVEAKFNDGGNLWSEDSIEIFLSPEGRKKYYQFIVNTIGSKWSEKFDARLVESQEPVWVEDWKAAVYKEKDYWAVEIMIPFGVFYPVTSQERITWKGNICRNITTGGDRFSSWVDIRSGGFHQPDLFGRIIFDKGFSQKDINTIEKSLLKKYLNQDTKKTESVILMWQKKDPRFFNKKLKKNLVEWKKTKTRLSDLDSLSPENIQRALWTVQKFVDLKTKIDNKLRKEWLLDGFF